jgi:putative flippase GtrA
LSYLSGPLSGCWRRLRSSPALAAKIIRFAMIGVLSGGAFALTTTLLVSGLGADPIGASFVGYCVSVPANFVGHRQFSFRSHGRWSAEAMRFLILQLVNIALTMGTMRIVLADFHASYLWGMLATVIVIPIANFIFTNLWVFRDQIFH